MMNLGLYVYNIQMLMKFKFAFTVNFFINREFLFAIYSFNREP